MDFIEDLNSFLNESSDSEILEYFQALTNVIDYFEVDYALEKLERFIEDNDINESTALTKRPLVLGKSGKTVFLNPDYVKTLSFTPTPGLSKKKIALLGAAGVAAATAIWKLTKRGDDLESQLKDIKDPKKKEEFRKRIEEIRKKEKESKDRLKKSYEKIAK